MKMMPIKFRNEYCDIEPDCQNGFVPFDDELGRHLRRIVELEPGITHNGGACITITILDLIIDKNFKYFEKALHSWNIFTYQRSQEIVPTVDQCQLISALASQDLRGCFAESTANMLFLNLILDNPKSGIIEYLPEVVSWYKRILGSKIEL